MPIDATGRAGFDRRAVARLALLSVILGTAWTARSLFSPLQELARADLSLDDVQLSLIQGAAMSVPAALLSILMGRLTDTGNRIRLLAVLAALTMLGSIGTAFARGFADLFAWRALAGLGMLEEAVVISLAADLFRPAHRGRANALIVLGEYAGSALGFVLAGWLMPLADALRPWFGLADWRTVQLICGVAGLALALPLLAMREPDRHECSRVAGRGLRRGLEALHDLRDLLWPLLLAQVAMAAANNAATIWAATILLRDFDVTVAQTGAWLALVMLVPGLAGAAIAGLLADRLHAVRGGTLGVAIVAAVLAVPAGLFPIAPTPMALAALLSIQMACHAAIALCGSTVGILAIPNDLRGMWMGVCGMLTTLISFAAVPTLVAVTGDRLGGAAHLADALAIVLAVANLLALLGVGLGWRALKRGPPGASDKQD